MKIAWSFHFVCKFITTIGHRLCVRIEHTESVDRQKLTLLSTTSPLNKMNEMIVVMSILSKHTQIHKQINNQASKRKRIQNVQSPLYWYGCSNDLIESFWMQPFSSSLLLHHQIAMNWNELICCRPQMIIGSFRSREMYIRFIYGNWTNQWDWDVMAQNDHLTANSQATIANQSANSAISIKKEID